MNYAIVKKMFVDKFLGWKLPQDFRPDAGISFTPRYNVGTPYERDHEPTGTNLFTADQAEAMFDACMPQNILDEECICRGNWRAIVAEVEPLIGETFIDERGDEYTFFGVVHGEDDYYYGMWDRVNRTLCLASCVGNFHTMGYTQKK